MAPCRARAHPGAAPSLGAHRTWQTRQQEAADMRSCRGSRRARPKRARGCRQPRPRRQNRGGQHRPRGVDGGGGGGRCALPVASMLAPVAMAARARAVPLPRSTPAVRRWAEHAYARPGMELSAAWLCVLASVCVRHVHARAWRSYRRRPRYWRGRASRWFGLVHCYRPPTSTLVSGRCCAPQPDRLPQPLRRAVPLPVAVMFYT